MLRKEVGTRIFFFHFQSGGNRTQSAWKEEKEISKFPVVLPSLHFLFFLDIKKNK